ncbi:MAG: hypothetical protein EXQ81_08070 [Thermoleophilia bacterium]|nr:hypothetical protein [Thermoleophilia bacterium]
MGRHWLERGARAGGGAGVTRGAAAWPRPLGHGGGGRRVGHCARHALGAPRARRRQGRPRHRRRARRGGRPEGGRDCA